MYKVTEILYKGKPKGIVSLSSEHPCAPSSGNNGCPCALIAIWNYLVLERQAPWEPNSDGYITQTRIRNYIYRTYVDIKADMKKTPHLYKEIEKRTELIQNLITALADGLAMIPDPHMPDNFERTDAVWLLVCLAIPVVHGHVNHEAHIKAKKQLEEQDALNSTLEIAKLKYSDTESEVYMTDYGITCLLNCQIEGELSVLYANGHYSLLLKHDELLLTLEKSQDLLASLPDAIWRRLSLVDGDSFYLTSRFSPTKKQRNIIKANQWYGGKLKALLGFSDDTHEADNVKKRAGRSIQTKLVPGREGSVSTNSFP